MQTDFEKTDVDPKLLRYIPKDYKQDVVELFREEEEWSEETQKWVRPVTVKLRNGAILSFRSAKHMLFALQNQTYF